MLSPHLLASLGTLAFFALGHILSYSLPVHEAGHDSMHLDLGLKLREDSKKRVQRTEMERIRKALRMKDTSTPYWDGLIERPRLQCEPLLGWID